MAEILVTNPSTEDSWRLDNRYIIRWENFGVTGNVRISLRESSGGTEVLEIDDNVYNTGFYLWEIPSNLDLDTDYFIRVETLDPFVGDGSDFAIIAKHTISDFKDLLNFEKIVLVELQAGRVIDTTFIGDRFLLKEDGDFLLKEDGDKIVLEQSVEA